MAIVLAKSCLGSGSMVVVRVLLCAALATRTSDAAAHGFLGADPSSKAEQVAVQFGAAQKQAADAQASPSTLLVAQSVYDGFLKWPFLGMTATVKVCFWNGSDDAKQAVINTDNAEWEGYANIVFDWYSSPSIVRVCNDANSADIRISLDPSDTRLDYDPTRPGNGDWSFVGRQANFPPAGGAADSRYLVTVNLPEIEGWVALNDVTDIHTYVGHELGHARGLLHEHQRDECQGWFNIPQIAQDNHWSIDAAKQNVASFTQLGIAAGNSPFFAGAYDVLSLMQYNFKPSWWLVKAGQVNPCLRTVDVQVPSPGDKATLIAAYGTLLPPAAAPGGTASTDGASPAPAADGGAAPSAQPGSGASPATPATAALPSPPPGAAAPGGPAEAPAAPPAIVAAAPLPKAAPVLRIAYPEALARLSSSIQMERSRAQLTSMANVDSAIANASSAASRLSPAERARVTGTLHHYRAANAATNRSAALNDAMDRLEAAALELQKVEQGKK